MHEVNQACDWLAVPTVGSDSPDDPLRPMYRITSSAIMVYAGRTVYIGLTDAAERQQLLARRGVRRLSPQQARQVANRALVPAALAASSPSQAIGLGDVISWLSRKLGIKECASCTERKQNLNRIRIGRRRRKERKVLHLLPTHQR